MRQEYDENLLLGYVEGELSDIDRARVEQWMAADPGLAKLLIGMGEDRAGLRKLPDPPTPEWMLEDVDTGLERAMLLDDGYEQDASVIEQKRNVLFRLSAYGGIAAMLLLGAYFVVQPLFDLHPTKVATDETKEGADAPPGPAVAMDHTPGRAADDPAETGVRGKGGRASDAVEQPAKIAKKGGEPRNDQAFVGKGGPRATGDEANDFAVQRGADAVNQQANEQLQALEVAMATKPADAIANGAALLEPETPELIEVVITTDDLTLTTRNINNLTHEFKSIELRQVAAEALQSRQRVPVVAGATQEAAVADAENAVAVGAKSLQGTEAVQADALQPDDATAAPTALANNFQVYVPHEQAKALIDRLREEGVEPRAEQARFNVGPAANAQVVIARRALTRAEQERYRSGLWPSYSPDYRAILQRVVPIEANQSGAARFAEQQLVEVIVEQRSSVFDATGVEAVADDAVEGRAETDAKPLNETETKAAD